MEAKSKAAEAKAKASSSEAADADKPADGCCPEKKPACGGCRNSCCDDMKKVTVTKYTQPAAPCCSGSTAGDGKDVNFKLDLAKNELKKI